ncbi:MAG: glutamate--tRNA ligase, partial [Paludibacteraceae bacterium]|nr:glutamate--tRNA ligase [Paludibacteraceae bacterium]
IESLNWLGIKFDEGIGQDGLATCRQSERKAIYRQYVDQLLNDGLAYIAFDTPAELDAKRQEIPNFQYDAKTRGMMKNSLTLSKEEVEARIAAGEVYVVRIKIEPGIDITVNDLIRGEVVINSSILDDKVLYKSADNLPTYHMANIVDDHLMEISHVIRGEEWLPSAPLHVLLYKYLGWEDSMPQFAHLPLLLKPDGNGKLSKRDGDRLGFPVFPLDWVDPKTGDKSSGYREAGYFPEAVVNFLALLGWHAETDQEFFSMDELIEAFSLERVSKSGAKFDYEKGKWFNHEYLIRKSDEELATLLMPTLVEKGINTDLSTLAAVVGITKVRCNFISDFWNQIKFFFEAPTEYDAKTVQKRWKATSAADMQALAAVLEGIDDFSAANSEQVVMAWITENGLHMGNIMNAFRLCIVGEGKGPHMFDITAIIGKEETLSRLQKAIIELK